MSRKKTLVLLYLAVGFYACNPPDEEIIYDYSLEDINPTSDTYGQTISPAYFVNQITVHYFGHQD